MSSPPLPFFKLPAVRQRYRSRSRLFFSNPPGPPKFLAGEFWQEAWLARWTYSQRCDVRKLADDGRNATIRHVTVPEMGSNGQLVTVTPRKRGHARFAERSEESTRLVRSRVAAKLVFLQRVSVDDHP